MDAPRLIELAPLVWAQVSAFVSVLASVRALRRERAPRARPSGVDAVLVRPCAGDEPGLRQALVSSRCAAAFGARVIVAVASSDDGAYPVARAAVDELRAAGVEARLVETHATRHANAKSGQLAAAIAGEPASVVVVVDSDVVLDEGLLGGVLAALEGERVGAAWVPPAEVAPARTLGDRASQALLCGSLHAFPLLAGIDPAGMVGKVFAVRREALVDAGGFEALTDVLGEDMELGRRLAASGWRVTAAPGLAPSLAAGRSAATVVARYGRWLQVIRAQRAALLVSYPLLFFPLLPLLALATLAPLRPACAGAVAGLAIGGRLVVAATARRVTTRQPPGLITLVDILLADGLLMTSFFRALTRRTVQWRGRSLALTSGGRLVTRASRAARIALSTLVLLALAVPAALALPKPGENGKNVRLEDADGRITNMETLLGKPILIVYEDKDSAKVNQAFKDELSKLAKGDKYKSAVALAAVADVTDYNYWPIKGFVKDSIRKESRKVGTTIFCDWDGHVRVSYAFSKGKSSVVLLSRQGTVLFASEGRMSEADRQRVIALLRTEVEG